MHLYVSLYLTLSGVTLPLHRHLRPFTANGAFLSRAPLPPPWSADSGVVCAGSADCTNPPDAVTMRIAQPIC